MLRPDPLSPCEMFEGISPSLLYFCDPFSGPVQSPCPVPPSQTPPSVSQPFFVFKFPHRSKMVLGFTLSLPCGWVFLSADKIGFWEIALVFSTHVRPTASPFSLYFVLTVPSVPLDVLHLSPTFRSAAKAVPAPRAISEKSATCENWRNGLSFMMCPSVCSVNKGTLRTLYLMVNKY